MGLLMVTHYRNTPPPPPRSVPLPPRQMLNAPLVQHHQSSPQSPSDSYPRYRTGMASPLNEWQIYGLSSSMDVPSPPPPVGQPLLDADEQSNVDRFFEGMLSDMMPPIGMGFDPELPKGAALWPEPDQTLPSEALPTASSGNGYYVNSATSSPVVNAPPIDVNPFNGIHDLLPSRPQHSEHVVMPAAPVIFGTDTNFAPNGYHPPPQALSLPDKDREIQTKIHSALKADSGFTTATNSPTEIKYEQPDIGYEHTVSPHLHRKDGIMSPHISGMKRRAEDSDELLQPSKSTRKTPQRQRNSDDALKLKKKLPGQKRDNLTEAQKRENHIHSEQKRRNLIRQGFDELCALVPDLAAGGYSKSAILTHFAQHLVNAKKDNARLRLYLQELERRGY